MHNEAQSAFELVTRIFHHHRVAKVTSVEKIDIGFSNDLYSVNGAYVLKLNGSQDDSKDLEREIYFCRLFQNRLPVPKIILADASRTLLDRSFVLYEKIAGDNLYAAWHLYSENQKKAIVRQICSYLRIINATSTEMVLTEFGSELEGNWHDAIYSNITQALDILECNRALEPELLQETRSFLDRHHDVLYEQRIALTYFDPHFDNFLVRDGAIVGMLDFERTDLRSIDYVLDLVRRMVEYPLKYVCAQYRPFIRATDYSHLLAWYREFYPELFAFADLETRLNLYSVEHTLQTMLYYPADAELKGILVKYLRQPG
jgi:aminoglycoside phosphotransferase (APT) family kinase protein